MAPAGLGAITIGLLTTPHTLAIQAGATPVRLWAVSLLASPPASARVIPHSVALSTASVADGLRISTTIDVLNPDSGPLVVALELWDRRQGTFFGRYGLRFWPAATTQSATVAIDLATGAPVAFGAAGEPLPLGVQQGAALPGSYTARLWVGADQRALLTPVDLFVFTIDRAGGITLDWAAQYPLMTARIDRRLQSLAAQFGDDMLLRGYDLLADRVVAGNTLAITLWWQALRGNLDERSIMLHLRNDRDERITDADGPPAAGGRPTSLWQAGEVIIDDRRLAIPADLPPGRYWLVVGSYRWPSLELVPLRDASEPVRRIPIEIIAPDDA